MKKISIKYIYESEIEKCFIKCLDCVDNKLNLNDRRLQFKFIFSKEHCKLFNNNNIESDNIDWSSYDGNVIFYYRFFKEITYTKNHFYINKIFGILT